MRIIFMGSPDTVLEPLKHLHRIATASGGAHELVAVVSQPARKSGRGKKLVHPAVAQYAEAENLHLLQPHKAGDKIFLDVFASLRPDLIVTAAYGQILTDDFLKIPTRGTINIHPSSLPKYRGATPVPAALLAGDTTTGITILFTVKALDAGNIICQKTTEIEPNETAQTLTARLFSMSTKLLDEALTLLGDASYVGREQDPRLVSKCSKISKQDGQIDWSETSLSIINKFRALHPWPGLFTFLNSNRIRLELISNTSSTSYPTQEGIDCEETSSRAPGTFIYSKKAKKIFVFTGDGCIALEKIKPSGSKVQDAAAFWNGIKTKNITPAFTAAEDP